MESGEKICVANKISFLWEMYGIAIAIKKPQIDFQCFVRRMDEKFYKTRGEIKQYAGSFRTKYNRTIGY